MAPIHRSRAAILGLATMLSIVVVARIATDAHEDPVAAAPDVPAGEETSGAGAMEPTRALTARPGEPTALPLRGSADVRWAPARSSPPPSLASIRVAVAQQALLSNDVDSMAVAAAKAAALARYETREHAAVETSAKAAALASYERSVYGAVETSRAAIQSADVR
jgi:hypothetical protein